MNNRKSVNHVLVYYDPTKWAGVPANNGANGPNWQWGNELVVGFTRGEAQFTEPGHQVSSDKPQHNWLARSTDGGETWITWDPEGYAGDPGYKIDDAVPQVGGLDFTSPGFMLRVEGYGYHANEGQQWFYSMEKAESWTGPFTFGDLLEHPELTGKEFTGRTAYLINGPLEADLFLSVRDPNIGNKISVTDKVFLARTTDGGKSFKFISWVVHPSDPHRAVMPAPVRLSPTCMVVALRRKSLGRDHWVDCCQSLDNGATWSFLSRVGDTGTDNGNPPALVNMADGRLCCVYGCRTRRAMLARFSEDGGKTWGEELLLRDGQKSINGKIELGYPRLFERPDGKLVTVYFWTSPERPETHIEATIFTP